VEDSFVRVRVPGDKSLTQRALILAGLATGESRLSGLLWGGDAASTAGALRRLGVPLPPLPEDGGAIRVAGVGLRGLRAPDGVLDLANSGTGTRLLAGVLAGSGITATLDGDASLRTRPMARITAPLRAMGAGFEHLREEGRLPMRVRGQHPLQPLDWSSPVASAQVKSAILLAGLTGHAFAMVTEPRRSRDHTERMLADVGAPVISHATEGGWRVELRDPPQRIDALDFQVPGDVSSAAFVLALAVLGGAGDGVTVEGVGLNPTRISFLDALRRMGAVVHVDQTSAETASEPVGDVGTGPCGLRGIHIGPAEVPSLIDELPLLAALGARAEGCTRIVGAGELRTKESDRIAAMVSNLRAVGVEVEELEDGLEVRGSDHPLRGSVQAFHDHRIAMSFAVLGSVPGNEITIDTPEVADVSFPGFAGLLRRLEGAA
jgi:3-phosphoshikimate 1-carboxyvinyltransferase